MKNDQAEREDARAQDEVMSETVVHDKVWGDSAEGPVRGEVEVATGGAWTRDVTRDPSGGPAVQNVDVLPSPDPAVRIARDAGTGAVTDEQTGGRAGIVGEDDRLIDRGK